MSRQTKFASIPISLRFPAEMHVDIVAVLAEQAALPFARNRDGTPRPSVDPHRLPLRQVLTAVPGAARRAIASRLG